MGNSLKCSAIFLNEKLINNVAEISLSQEPDMNCIQAILTSAMGIKRVT